MIYLAPLLHFYQPSTQFHRVLKKVCNESYRPLVNLFHEQSHAKVTVNINAVLTEMLDEHGMSDVIDGLRELSEMGRLEFVGSAKYHPILPLIPQDEMLRQIAQNHQTNRRYFGKAYSPTGFFSPEMCYSREVVKPICDTGHRWLVLGGVACPVAWPNSLIHRIRGDGESLSVFFRDDVLSNRIAFKQTDVKAFIEQLRAFGGKTSDIYVVTAMDAETFGHHIRHWEDIFLAEMYEALQPEPSEEGPRRSTVERLVQPVDLAKQSSELLLTREVAKTGEIRVVTISQLLELFPAGSYVEPRASSWSTSAEDIQAGNPYPLWNSKENLIHQLQWQHLKIAIELTRKAERAASNDAARNYADLARGLLDRAMQSDQFWWASRRPMWDINLVNRGLMQQREVVFNAYKAIRLGDLSEEEKTEAYYRVIVSRDLRTKITDQLFIL
jgi:alpha-amylase/alpha-mannosidase (GH57 family)